MRHGFLVSVALAALVATAPASLAFELQGVPTTSDGSAKITDPGNLTDNVPGKSDETALHFGNTTLRFSGGNGSRAFGSSSSGMSPALQERLMLGPYAVGSTAQLR